mgnify:CR=1 FL=1
MDKIECAREMFQQLEGCGNYNAAEIARRTFFIEDSLARIRN